MSTTNFTAGTVIASDWLNDVDAATYEGAAVFTPAGTGASARTVQAKLRESVSVKDFGATGDGTTDDTAAIQAAIDSLSLGGEVLIPPGGYLISSTIAITKAITLRGTVRENQTLTRIFKKSTLNAPAILVTGSNASLQNFALTGQAGNGGNGITILQQYWELKNLTITSMGQDGVRLGDSSAATNCNIGTMTGVVSQSNTRHGFFFDSQSTNAGGAAFLNCFSQLNGGDGFNLARSQLNTFVGCVSETNTGYGINFDDGARDNWWFAGDSEQNTAGQYNKHANALRCNAIGGWGQTSGVNLGIGCRVRRTSNQAINNATSTAIAFDQEQWDTDGMHSNVTNNSRVTFTTSGPYIVTATIGFNANATGHRLAKIRLNNLTDIAIENMPAFTGDSNVVSLSTVYNFSVGDYIEVYAYQNSGGSLDLTAFDQAFPVLSVIRQN